MNSCSKKMRKKMSRRSPACLPTSTEKWDHPARIIPLLFAEFLPIEVLCTSSESDDLPDFHQNRLVEKILK